MRVQMSVGVLHPPTFHPPIHPSPLSTRLSPIWVDLSGIVCGVCVCVRVVGVCMRVQMSVGVSAFCMLCVLFVTPHNSIREPKGRSRLSRHIVSVPTRSDPADNSSVLSHPTLRKAAIYEAPGATHAAAQTRGRHFHISKVSTFPHFTSPPFAMAQTRGRHFNIS